MTRFIEIFADDDIQLLTTDELPFVIALDSESKQHINIYSLHDINDTVQSIQCAYLAEEDGHLFIQPEANTLEQQQVKLFHNDEIIHQSVWIKSGDIIRIENKMIAFQISGDRIEIKIVDRKEIKLLSPPPVEERIIIQEKNNSQALPDVSKDYDKKHKQVNKSSRNRKNLLLMLLVLLTTIASFIVFAETVNIIIEPEVEQLEIKGLLPVVKLGHRYIAIAGQYQIMAKKEGYKILNEMIKIDSEKNFFSFKMQETPGIVQFNVTPKQNNEIFLNDRLLGNSYKQHQPIQYEVDKGDYDLKIINPKYKAYEQRIKIAGKNIVQIFSPVLQSNLGILEINSKPENADIKIKPITKSTHNRVEDNEIHTTPAKIELIAGEYQLEISKDKYKSKHMTINIAAQEQIIMDSIELQGKDAKVIVNSVPSAGVVQVDGQYAGKTPITVSLSSLSEHQIEISRSGYKNYTEKLSLEPEEIKQLTVNLEAVTGSVFISSTPRQAKLYINGQLQKNSSGKFYLQGKNNTLTVKAKGYKTQSRKIDANSYNQNISFILEKGKSNNSAAKRNSTIGKTSIKSAKTYRNSIGQKMILLQPTVFTMGSAKNEIGRRSNEQQHQVKLTRAFYLSEKEVTNQQFKLFKPEHSSGFSAGLTLDKANQPVVNISWNDAAKFANWLSKKEGLNPYYKEQQGKMTAINRTAVIDGYRLPYDAEWEYAARGNKHNKYPWNGTYPPKVESGNFADESARTQVSLVIEGYNDHNSVSAAVGSFEANALGFYDMGGNVSEWCQDYYVPYVSSKQLIIDPIGPENGVHKVVRDSSYRDSSITELRLSYRNYSKKAMNDIGFRLARYAK